jgi:hypothetical protein
MIYLVNVTHSSAVLRTARSCCTLGAPDTTDPRPSVVRPIGTVLAALTEVAAATCIDGVPSRPARRTRVEEAK